LQLYNAMISVHDMAYGLLYIVAASYFFRIDSNFHPDHQCKLFLTQEFFRCCFES